MDEIGSVLGAILAFLLLPVLGYKNIFLFAFISGVIAMFIILFIKETNTPTKEKEISFKLILVVIYSLWIKNKLSLIFIVIEWEKRGYKTS